MIMLALFLFLFVVLLVFGRNFHLFQSVLSRPVRLLLFVFILLLFNLLGLMAF